MKLADMIIPNSIVPDHVIQRYVLQYKGADIKQELKPGEMGPPRYIEDHSNTLTDMYETSKRIKERTGCNKHTGRTANVTLLIGPQGAGKSKAAAEMLKAYSSSEKPIQIEPYMYLNEMESFRSARMAFQEDYTYDGYEHVHTRTVPIGGIPKKGEKIRGEDEEEVYTPLVDFNTAGSAATSPDKARKMEGVTEPYHNAVRWIANDVMTAGVRNGHNLFVEISGGHALELVADLKKAGANVNIIVALAPQAVLEAAAYLRYLESPDFAISTAQQERELKDLIRILPALCALDNDIEVMVRGKYDRPLTTALKANKDSYNRNKYEAGLLDGIISSLHIDSKDLMGKRIELPFGMEVQPVTFEMA